MGILLSVDIGIPPHSGRGRYAKKAPMGPLAPKKSGGLYQTNAIHFNFDPLVLTDIQKGLMELAYGAQAYTAQTKAMVAALGSTYRAARKRIPAPGKPAKLKGIDHAGREIELGEYGKTGNLQKAFAIIGNPPTKFPGAKLGINKKFSTKVRRGKHIANSTPASYAHLVELGFVAKSRVPGIAERRKIKRPDRGKETTIKDLGSYHKKIINNVKNTARRLEREVLNGNKKLSFFEDKVKSALNRMDKTFNGQTKKGDAAKRRLTSAKRRRIAKFMVGITKQNQTTVPGVFFVKRAWEETKTLVAASYLVYVTAEYAKLLANYKRF